MEIVYKLPRLITVVFILIESVSEYSQTVIAVSNNELDWNMVKM